MKGFMLKISCILMFTSSVYALQDGAAGCMSCHQGTAMQMNLNSKKSHTFTQQHPIRSHAK